MKPLFPCFLAGIVFYAFLAAPGQLRAVPKSANDDVAVLDQILAGVAPGQKLVTVGDMDILVSNLTAWRNQLAGQPSPQSAFDGAAPIWTGGNVYYVFSNSGSNTVSPSLQKAFLDAAGEWAMFANLHFLPRSTQSNYVSIQVNNSLEGGQSAVGMVGGQQFLSVSPNAWNRGTLCHEIGHTLGLVHEHQRSDRNSYVTIFTNNIVSGGLGNFVILSNSRNQGAYDFLSVMHYARNYLATAPTLDTIEPLPAFTNFINLMGEPGPTTLSALDRAGMAAIYGSGPVINSLVTNTQDSGPGSLRAALYYAFDHPGTTVTFNIATNDPGFANGVFTIQPTDQLPSLVNATVINGASQPASTHSHPAIQLNGAQAPVPGTFANGLLLVGTNCAVRSLAVNGFSASGILIHGANAISNSVSGCYLGINAAGDTAVTNGFSPLTIDQGASANLIGGPNATNRNIISGSAYQGLVIRDPGTRNNLVQGNYCGLNAAGTGPLPNAWSGVAIFNAAQFNVIGGTLTGQRNIISGNGEQGVTLSDTNTTGNIVAGNYIGQNSSGTAALSNTWSGVNIFGGAHGNTIGGTAAGSANVISGNGCKASLFRTRAVMGILFREITLGLTPPAQPRSPIIGRALAFTVARPRTLSVETLRLRATLFLAMANRALPSPMRGLRLILWPEIISV